jgi:hypothetical protein
VLKSAIINKIDKFSNLIFYFFSQKCQYVEISFSVKTASRDVLEIATCKKMTKCAPNISFG